MTVALELCRCGHLADEHVPGAGCRHENQASRRHAVTARCACGRYAPDERLTDSEDFIGKLLEKVLAREGIPVEPVERAEALQVLRIQLWRTSCKYDSRSHIRFRVYAYFELYNDAIDHFRSERGRHGQHRVFDARFELPDVDLDDAAAGADRLDGAASPDPADDPESWAADAGGLLAEGDRAPARPLGRQGGRARRRTADGDHRPGGPARGRAGAAAAGARPGAAFIDCAECGWRSYREAPNGLPGWHWPDACPGCGARLEGGVTGVESRP